MKELLGYITIIYFMVIIGVDLYIFHSYIPAWLAYIPAWLVILTIASITLIFFIFYFIKRQIDKREKEVANYLDECDEKLKNGEMSEEENKDIHFYYEAEFNF